MSRHNNKLLALYGLKFNPFAPSVPTEALYLTEAFDRFCWRVEHTLLREGGFALVSGEPGSGKSAILRLLAERLEAMSELTVAVLTHPQSNLADFYREMGDVFAVSLRPHNRWGGFKVLRERWQAHLQNARLRPVLLIDEAQEMSPTVLNELRLLSSARFDSHALLSAVLAGDPRLLDKLRREELVPLGSRIRIRLSLEYAERDQLRTCLEHLLTQAGNAQLMTPELIETLCEHALGNYRVLSTLAAELLAEGARRELPQLDEKLYFDLFPPPAARRRTSKEPARH